MKDRIRDWLIKHGLLIWYGISLSEGGHLSYRHKALSVDVWVRYDPDRQRFRDRNKKRLLNDPRKT